MNKYIIEYEITDGATYRCESYKVVLAVGVEEIQLAFFR